MMQQGAQRAVMIQQPSLPHTPSMQHPGMPSQSHEAAAHHQMAMMNGRMVSFDPSNITEETRLFIQHQQQQQLQQQQLQPHDAQAQFQRQQQMQLQQQQQQQNKAAGQRALGVNAGQQQMHMGQQGVRPMMTQQGPVYVDAQGRPVQLNAAQMNAQRAMQNGQFTQAQYAQFAQQQHHLLQQQQQQQYQQHLAQQQLGQRASQPPVARPPLQTQVTGQSPAMLQVPPPMKRNNSAVASRSASPIPPHLRPPHPSTAQPMQASTSAMPSTGNSTAILPARASTLPSLLPIDNTANPPQPAAGLKSKFTKAHPTPAKREVKLSAVAKARKRESMSTRLQRHIEQAQARLNAVKKEEEEARKVKVQSEGGEEQQRKFNELIVEYLTRAGYTSAATALHDVLLQQSTKNSPKSPVKALADQPVTEVGESSAPADGTVVSSMSGDISVDLQTPAGTSPAKISSPIKQKSPIKLDAEPAGTSPEMSSPTLGDSPVIKLGSSSSDGSIFGGSGGGENDSPTSLLKKSEVNTAMSPEKRSSPEIKPSPSPGEKIKQEAVEEKDLGYLYSWYTVFEESLRLARRGLLKAKLQKQRTPPAVNGSAPPSSAMAARIAVSSPMSAVRASSVDQNGQSGNPQAHPIATENGLPSQIDASAGPPTAVTATFQQAEEMRKHQQAQIDAQQEAARRNGVQGQNGRAPPNVSRRSRRTLIVQHYNPALQRHLIMLPNGQQVQMTHDEYVSHQQQLQAHQAMQQQTLRQQSFAGQQNGTFRSVTPNGQARQFHPVSQQMIQQNDSASPSTDSGLSSKRQADVSPVDGPSKRAKVSGKRPTPEEHQRQVMEIANRVGNRSEPMAAPGVPQPARNGSQVSNTLPDLKFYEDAYKSMLQTYQRPTTEAERLYAQTQANYARQQVANSPANMTGMSPAEMTAPSPLSFDPPGVSVNGHVSQRPTSAKGKGRGRLANTLSLDSEMTLEGGEQITPTSAPAAKRKVSHKKVGGKTPVGGKGKGGKAPKARVPSDQSDPQSPPDTSQSGFTMTATPTNAFTAPSSAPGSSQSQIFQLPPTNLELVQESEGKVPNQDIPPLDEDFFASLANFTNGVDSGPPMSATMSINYEDAGTFDFDWATANFGGGDDGWTLQDPTAES
ncbi:hypothetical protein P7C73_g3356, partial [Tremellales sp. Uapishka_1]